MSNLPSLQTVKENLRYQRHIFGVYPSASEIDRPDHPDLVSSGCWEKSKGAMCLGLILGGSIGALYAGVRAIQTRQAPRELLRIVGKNGMTTGFFSGGALFIFVSINCWV